jgi:hypothetical protein
MIDTTKLEELPARGFCWVVGNTRLGNACTIYPTSPQHGRPVIVGTGRTIDDAVVDAIARLGSQKPQPPHIHSPAFRVDPKDHSRLKRIR